MRKIQQLRKSLDDSKAKLREEQIKSIDLSKKNDSLSTNIQSLKNENDSLKASVRKLSLENSSLLDESKLKKENGVGETVTSGDKASDEVKRLKDSLVQAVTQKNNALQKLKVT